MVSAARLLSITAIAVLFSAAAAPALAQNGRIRGVVHDAHNTSDKPIKLVGVYVVEKGKPLASPAP